jgi:hypothetical protein
MTTMTMTRVRRKWKRRKSRRKTTTTKQTTARTTIRLTFAGKRLLRWTIRQLPISCQTAAFITEVATSP